MREILMVAAMTAIVFYLLGIHPASADGFEVRDIRIEVGGGVTQGATEEVEAGSIWRGTLGVDDFPVYLYGQKTEFGTIAILGQEVAQGTAKSLGLGFEHPLGRKLSVFAEAGFMDVGSFEANDNIVQEVVYTQIVGAHNVIHRPIPIDNVSCRQCGYESEWTLDDTMEFRIGLRYELTEYGFASIAYRFARTEEYYRIYDPVWNARYANDSWWEENKQRDLGGVEFTVGVRF